MRVNEAISNRMNSGDAIVLFAEGTSSNGNEVKPFRSSLLGAVHQAMQTSATHSATVQPLSIAYTRLHGMPMGRMWRPHVAWYGNMELLQHLWSICGEGGLDVEVHFGEPTKYGAEFNRKQVAKQMEAEVRSMTLAALYGKSSA